MMKTIITALMSLMFVATAQAATVEVMTYGDGTKYMMMHGAIEEGDLERLEKVYWHADTPYAIDLQLSSPGGSGWEMKKIAEWIRERNGITTVVSNGNGCFSACAVIWAHGVKKYVQRGSEIGFHVSSVGMGPDGIAFLNGWKDSYGWVGIQTGIQQSYADDLTYYYNMPVTYPNHFVAQIGMVGGGDNFWMMTEDNAWIVGNVNYF